VRRLDELPGVRVVGPVEDMAVELRRCAAAVIPMLTGSGTKNKVLEAMATGTPVVSNRLGIQGLVAARAGVDHLHAEGAAGLATAAVELLRSPRRRDALAVEGRRLVEQRYTWAAQAEALIALYGTLSPGGGAYRPAAVGMMLSTSSSEMTTSNFAIPSVIPSSCRTSSDASAVVPSTTSSLPFARLVDRARWSYLVASGVAMSGSETAPAARGSKPSGHSVRAS
jgi:hypothetical protein